MNKDEIFPLLELRRGNAFIPENFQKGLILPQRVFPPRFTIQTKDSFCGGYFLCYDRKVDAHKILQECKNRNWQFLANLIGDFFIIYCDFIKRELFLFTGQSSTFPCYFTLTSDKFILSPEFGLVCRKIPKKTLDVGSALDFIYFQLVAQRTPDTFISEIKQLPPGNLLKINKDFSYSIRNLIDFDGFYSPKPQVYESSELFVSDLLSLLSTVINEQLATIQDMSCGAELSSGFDSSIVCYLLKRASKKAFICYSSIASAVEEFDPKETIQEFSRKHGLRTIFLDVSDFYPFATRHDILWTKRYFFPADHGQEQVYRTWSKYREDGANLIFTGFGGDELYGVSAEAEIAPFVLQREFFKLVRAFRYGDRRVLTDRGEGLLLDRERFANKNFYLSIIPTSSTAPALFYFPMYWRLNCWQITPFIDPRVLRLALNIPRKDNKLPTRHELFRHRNEIFVPLQFRNKIGGGSYVSQFLEKRRELVISILHTSLLGQSGWVKSEEIIKDLKGDNIRNYIANSNLLAQLHNLVRLEYFIQQNNVKVPD